MNTAKNIHGSFLSLAALLLLAVGTAGAQTTATQTFSTQVDVVRAITVSGNPSTMTITAATAGTGLTSVTNTSTTYSLTTNDTVGVGDKVTAKISSGGAMASGETLTLTLAAPGGGGSSAGALALTTSDQDYVTGVTPQNASGRQITYTFAATVSAVPRNAVARTITFTILSGA